MNREQLEFVLYCVENRASDTGKDTIEVYDLLKNSGVLYVYCTAIWDSSYAGARLYRGRP